MKTSTHLLLFSDSIADRNAAPESSDRYFSGYHPILVILVIWCWCANQAFAGLGYGAAGYGKGWYGYGPGRIVAANVVSDPSMPTGPSVGFTLPEGTSAQVTLRLSTKPPANQIINISRFSGDTDIAVSGTSQFTFTPANWNQDQTVTILAAPDVDNSNGLADIRCSSAEVSYADFLVTESDRTGTDDFDADGQSNQTEYITGSDWLSGQSFLQTSIVRQGANLTVSFQAVATTPEYGGKVRHYKLETTADLGTAAWSTVSGAADITADGPYSYSAPPSESRRFYRTTVWLTP